MKALSRFVLSLLFLSGITLLPACWKRGKTPEALMVPRLMLEPRGVNAAVQTVNTVTLPVSGTQIPLGKEPLISEFDIVNVEMVKVDMGIALLIQTSELGARALYRGTVTNMGGRIVLLVNGNPIGARRIDGAIQDGNFFTFVEVDGEELGQLVLDLKESIAYLQERK